MLEVVAVAAGAFLGGVLRSQFARLSTPRRPFGTFTANTLACLVLGAASVATLTPLMLLLLATGFCGALSTMSTFIKEVVTLKWKSGSCYVAATLLCGSLAFYCGQLAFSM